MKLPLLFFLILRLASAMRAQWRHQRDRRVLNSMSERELLDLGIGRSQIPGLVDRS